MNMWRVTNLPGKLPKTKAWRAFPYHLWTVNRNAASFPFYYFTQISWFAFNMNTWRFSCNRLLFRLILPSRLEQSENWTRNNASISRCNWSVWKSTPPANSGHHSRRSSPTWSNAPGHRKGSSAALVRQSDRREAIRRRVQGRCLRMRNMFERVWRWREMQCSSAVRPSIPSQLHSVVVAGTAELSETSDLSDLPQQGCGIAVDRSKFSDGICWSRRQVSIWSLQFYIWFKFHPKRWFKLLFLLLSLWSMKLLFIQVSKNGSSCLTELIKDFISVIANYLSRFDQLKIDCFIHLIENQEIPWWIMIFMI